MASGPEGTDPVNCKTWVLKVSIHCEGCKKKIKKILHKVKGVYSIDVDAKQDRVTVTGNVDAESLIQKLLDYGKHAELSPERIPSAAADSSNAAAPAAKTEAKSSEKAAAAAATAAPEEEKKKQAERGKAVESPVIPAAESPETPPATAAASDKVPAPKAGIDAPRSQPEKKNSEKVAAVDAGGKKKGKEIKKEESKEEERELAGVNSTPANPFPANLLPSYTTVSYHAVHPSTSYAYYAAPPPDMPSNYTYYGNPPPPTPAAYPLPETYPSEYYYSSESYYRSLDQPSPSTAPYDMFNDENPNACKLM